jgi:hypothetical protein
MLNHYQIFFSFQCKLRNKLNAIRLDLTKNIEESQELGRINNAGISRLEETVRSGNKKLVDLSKSNMVGIFKKVDESKEKVVETVVKMDVELKEELKEVNIKVN